MRGDLIAGSGLLLPPDASAPVRVSLHLETHFGSVDVPLIKHQHEQDATALKQQIASGAVEHQLQRAVMWAVACLLSSQPETQQAGESVLNTVDRLERYVAAWPIKASENCGKNASTGVALPFLKHWQPRLASTRHL